MQHIPILLEVDDLNVVGAPDLAGIRFRRPLDDPQQSSFTRSVRADEPQPGAGREHEPGISKQGLAPEGFRDVFARRSVAWSCGRSL